MTPEERLAETVRVEGRRVLATLVRTVGSLTVAEDAVQDAVLTALALLATPMGVAAQTQTAPTVTPPAPAAPAAPAPGPGQR